MLRCAFRYVLYYLQMMNWQERARARMKELGLRQEDLTDALGVTTRSAVGHYFNDRRSLSVGQAKALCSVLKMTFYQLFDEAPANNQDLKPLASRPSNAEEITTLYQAGLAQVPVLNAELSAGTGCYLEQEDVIGYMPIPHTLLYDAGVDESVARVVKVKGESMEETFHDGDSVLVNTSKTRLITDKIYAFRIEGELRIKRFARRIDGSWRVLSDNPDKDRFPEETIAGHNMDRVKIIGEVIALVFRRF